MWGREPTEATSLLLSPPPPYAASAAAAAASRELFHVQYVTPTPTAPTLSCAAACFQQKGLEAMAVGRRAPGARAGGGIVRTSNLGPYINALAAGFKWGCDSVFFYGGP